MKRFGIIILSLLFIFAPWRHIDASCPPEPAAKTKTKTKSKPKKTNAKSKTKTKRSSDDIKREQQQTRREINETRRALDDNTRKTRRNLDQLNRLDAQIARQQLTINSLSSRLDTINSQILMAQDSIKALEHDITLLRTDLKHTLRQLRARRNRINSLTFVFSAPNFTSALKRYSYLSQLRHWQTGKITRLRDKLTELDSRRAGLQTLKDKHSATLGRLNVARQMMTEQQQQSQQLVVQLQSQGSALQRVLNDKRRRLSQLDSELNRIIEAERREAQRRQQRRQNNGTSGSSSSKPERTAPSSTADENRALSGPFSSNKGRLLFPVAGRYTIVGNFGRSTRGGLAIDNSGIDISVAPGTKARAVFDGTVTSVFMMPTYHSVIIVRHGAYLTVYAGLSNITVSKGQKVKTGQTLGTVFTDTADDNRTELHFEVRHERTKLNPMQWVK